MAIYAIVAEIFFVKTKCQLNGSDRLESLRISNIYTEYFKYLILKQCS